jgi:endo-1,4-beta-xylanase
MIASSPAPPLPDLAARRGLWIGPCVAATPLATDAEYAEVLRREFNAVTPENAMKWGPIHPARDRYDFAGADAIVDFAAANGMAVHGHTLAWHRQNPDWLTASTTSRDETIALLREHIATVAGRYAGNVAAWDVVNEAVADDGTLHRTVWLDRIGPDYLAIAFQAAAEADPQARLLYNDYGAEAGNAKSDAIFDLLARLVRAGAPVHGVGFQCHLTTGGLDLGSFARNLQRFAGLGLALYVTEMDVRLPLPASEEALAAQAALYRGVLEACLDQPAFRGFQTWGFTDKHSWIAGRFPGHGAALLFDERYRPKPAYAALHTCLAARP